MPGIVILVILFILVVIIVATGAYTVKQQTYAIIERLGKYKKIVGPGFHIKIPILDKIAMRVNMRTHQSDFNPRVKTKDNVSLNLRISSQYRVNDQDPQGVYKSYYMLSNPIQQMESYIIDALRSAVPNHTLDEVYEKKDDIAIAVNNSVGALMQNYGFQVVSTLITDIQLPRDVEDSMNSINAAQREKDASISLAEAEKIKMVTEAKAKAESAKLAGEGIAAQRKAIAEGIAGSLDTIKASGVSTNEANQLFMFSQYNEMMNNFAERGNSSTIVLPSDFRQTSSMFDQILTANKAIEAEENLNQ